VLWWLRAALADAGLALGGLGFVGGLVLFAVVPIGPKESLAVAPAATSAAPAFRVPGTDRYDWATGQVVTAVGAHLFPGADAAVVTGALAWPPPDHPDAASYAARPPADPWTPGAWLVETSLGRWWVIEAYGLVAPADDLARRQAPGRRYPE
jgi:hypothetical protein